MTGMKKRNRMPVQIQAILILAITAVIVSSEAFYVRWEQVRVQQTEAAIRLIILKTTADDIANGALPKGASPAPTTHDNKL